LHERLCHPGIRGLHHYVRQKNLPFAVQDVKHVCNNCKVCAEIKPCFGKHAGDPMITALHPFDRISIDFKGPLPTASKNNYLLTVVDAFIQYPFAFPCSDITAATVKCLSQIFAVFGLPRYVHNARAASFMSRELKEYLHNKLIATSHSSPYNPTGNSQVERFNGIIWRTVKLVLETRGLPVTHWESVLIDALHSIRSLLCTATNCTPHERMFSFPQRAACAPSLLSW